LRPPKYLSDLVIIFILIVLIWLISMVFLNINSTPGISPQGLTSIIMFGVFLVVTLASIISMKKQNKYFYERFNVFNTSFLSITIILTIISLIFTTFSTIFLETINRLLFGLINSGEGGSNATTTAIFFSLFILAVIYSKIAKQDTHRKALIKSIFSLFGIYLFGAIIFLFVKETAKDFIATNNIFLLITFTIVIFQFFTFFATILSPYFGDLFKDDFKMKFFIIQLIIGILILTYFTYNATSPVNSLLYAITYSGFVNFFRKSIS